MFSYQEFQKVIFFIATHFAPLYSPLWLLSRIFSGQPAVFWGKVLVGVFHQETLADGTESPRGMLGDFLSTLFWGFPTGGFPPFFPQPQFGLELDLQWLCVYLGSHFYQLLEVFGACGGSE